MLTFAKIGWVGLVLLSSKMANAETCPAGKFFDEETPGCLPCNPGEYQPEEGKNTCHKCPDKKFSDQGAKSVEDCKDQWIKEDYQCHTKAKPIIHPLGHWRAECNSSSHFCNKDGWCQLITTQHKRDDADDTDDKAQIENKDEDKVETDTDDDCQHKICIDFTQGYRHQGAFSILRDVYRWNTFFVKSKKMENGRSLYTSVDKSGKKDKYAMWWIDGNWMVGDYEKRTTWSAFAYAQSEEKCPEKIDYHWKYFDGNTFKWAGKGMSVYNKCSFVLN